MRKYLATAEYKDPLPWSDAKGFEFIVEERRQDYADKIAILRAQLIMREVMDFRSLSVTELQSDGVMRFIHFQFEPINNPLGGFHQSSG